MSKRCIKNVAKPFWISQHSIQRINKTLRARIPLQRGTKRKPPTKGQLKDTRGSSETLERRTSKDPDAQAGANSWNCRSDADSHLHFASEIKKTGHIESHKMDHIVLIGNVERKRYSVDL